MSNLNLIIKKSYNTRMEKEEKEEERKSRRAVARAATHNFMQVFYLCFCSIFVFFCLLFVYLLVLAKAWYCKVFFAGLEEQYERCERQSYQVTEVNLKLFLADFQGLCQVLTYGIFPKGGEGRGGHSICNFFFTQKKH